MKTRRIIGAVIALGAGAWLVAPAPAAVPTAYGPYCVNTIVKTGDFRVGPVHFYPSDKECVEINP